MGKREMNSTHNPFASVEVLEKKLQSSLEPVQPDPGFVYRLYGRLVNQPTVVLERRTNSAVLMVLALGLFLGALIIWLFRWISGLLPKARPFQGA